MSIAAVSEAGDLAGFGIAGWIYENDPIDLSKYRHPQTQAVGRLFKRAYQHTDVFKKFGVDRICEHKILSVDPK